MEIRYSLRSLRYPHHHTGVTHTHTPLIPLSLSLPLDVMHWGIEYITHVSVCHTHARTHAHTHTHGQAVIFCNTKRKVDWLTDKMRGSHTHTTNTHTHHTHTHTHTDRIVGTETCLTSTAKFLYTQTLHQNPLHRNPHTDTCLKPTAISYPHPSTI
jgi:hypothetical protein